MYALIYSYQSATEAKVWATARTLRAIQRKWNRDVLPSMHYIGILGPNGLINYNGEPIPKAKFGRVECHLEVRLRRRNSTDALLTNPEHDGDERLRITA